MATPEFWLGFIRSFHFIRIIMFALVYFVLPVDFMPERLFGIIGLIDDIFIIFFLVLLGVVHFAPIFIRRGRGR
jgi:RING finger protein 170